MQNFQKTMELTYSKDIRYYNTITSQKDIVAKCENTPKLTRKKAVKRVFQISILEIPVYVTTFIQFENEYFALEY